MEFHDMIRFAAFRAHFRIIRVNWCVVCVVCVCGVCVWCVCAWAGRAFSQSVFAHSLSVFFLDVRIKRSCRDVEARNTEDPLRMDDTHTSRSVVDFFTRKPSTTRVSVLSRWKFYLRVSEQAIKHAERWRRFSASGYCPFSRDPLDDLPPMDAAEHLWAVVSAATVVSSSFFGQPNVPRGDKVGIGKLRPARAFAVFHFEENLVTVVT